MGPARPCLPDGIAVSQRPADSRQKDTDFLSIFLEKGELARLCNSLTLRNVHTLFS